MNLSLRSMLLVVFMAALLVGSLAGDALAISPTPASATSVSIKPVEASGGGYHLTSSAWHIAGSATAPGYHIEELSVPSGTGTPCCCSYLTCTHRR